MQQVPENIKFSVEEEKILQFWNENKIFEQSLKRSEGLPEYSFYDGPPFATGLPHYGHILAGTIKDTVTRYAHQTGHHVVRRFGWDCHGLPIEFEIDKSLGINTPEQVKNFGIANYNNECRKIVMRYSSEWETIVNRLGRWIDFKNDYKTMDKNFMESVWWVFKQMFEKGMVYRGLKVMPFSTMCNTPLSNFEAGMNYKEISDPEIYVLFPLEEDKNVSLVAWTTTPWTLPSNLALCVNPDFVYLKVRNKETNEIYIVAESRITCLYKNKKDASNFETLEKFKGSELEGKKYIPLFDYFTKYEQFGAFKVVCDNYVKEESGTGIVHQAPAFGEDDYRVCKRYSIVQKDGEVPCPVGPNGHFTSEVKDFEGIYVKDADEKIKNYLKTQGRVYKSGSIVHSYPFCWRSETPLIYKAIPSWFVRVEEIRDNLIANNKQTYWVPSFVQEKRFHNWLLSARDWAISRNRYWGTPLPIWTNEDFSEVVCIGSIAELETLSGQKIEDLHREFVDKIEIPSQKGNGVLRRVDEVFDCWFESGSMPYAQVHYPFENKEWFESTFPADFIAEGIDQTRGWFYTLMIISTILFDKPAFKNLIVNGLVLAEDGKKMSKRLKNYPDPMDVVNEFGSDALRLYLINSPVVCGEDLRFKKSGVKDVVKDAFLPWYHSYRFLVTSIAQSEQKYGYQFSPQKEIAEKSKNIMDRWIIAEIHSLVEFVNTEMKGYRLYTVLARLVKFIDLLTNWYIRFNRKRLRGAQSVEKEDSIAALNTLFEVEYLLVILMAPFTPFLTELIYQNLRLALPLSEREESVHLLRFPTANEELIDRRIIKTFKHFRSVVEFGRASRERRNLPLKLPLNDVTIIHRDSSVLDDLQLVKHYFYEELNVREIHMKVEEKSYLSLAIKVDNKLLGKRLKSEAKNVINELQKLTVKEIEELQMAGSINVLGHEVCLEELQIIRTFIGPKTLEATWDDNLLVIINCQLNEDLLLTGAARQLINKIQRQRKHCGIQAEDDIRIYWKSLDLITKEKLSSVEELLQNALGRPFSELSVEKDLSLINTSEFEFLGGKVAISLVK